MAAPAISVGSLLEEAASRAGSDAWGDLSFVPALELLVDSCRETAELTPSGWQVLRKVALRHLRNRLALQQRVANVVAPAAPPAAPIVITGIPRTGTSMLHNLLAQDHDNRVLRLWEALRPGAAGAPDGPGQHALVEQAESWLRGFQALAPRFAAIHGVTVHGPEECDALLQNSFASQHFDDMFDARRYSHWYAAADLVDEYRYYALQLALLSASDDGARNWVLKSPAHLGHLDALLHVLPDALIVHCHRRPAEAVPSYASLIRTVRAPHTERLELRVVGRQALQRASVAMQRALAVRRVAGADRFVDVCYERLLRDPLGVVVEVYARAGRRLPTAARRRIQQWLADNPQHRHDVHRYGLAEFGLDAEQVNASFADYLDRTSLPRSGCRLQ